jgi:putative tryptophan/tyrosine transport system substrate-binding protein
VKRREFLIGGAAAAWPLVAPGQPPGLRELGILGGAKANEWAPFVAAFGKGMSEIGYAEGRNITSEAKWAEGQYDRLPAMATELVQRRVDVIVAFTTPAARAAKVATATIPIVFTTISDPVQLGLVTSLSRPGGNLTGVTRLEVEVGQKLLELLHEVVPIAKTVAMLINPRNPNVEAQSKNLQAAAHLLGLQLHTLTASTERDIDAVSAALDERRIGGLVVVGDAFINSRSEKLAALALRQQVPAIFSSRASAAVGGLLSYGGDQTDQYRQAGVYTGRILNGEKPADLPVIQSTKFELVINLKTAKALGLEVPAKLLFTADEVIE